MRSKIGEESETIMTEVVCPNDTNPLGILQGGKLVQWLDIASAVTAQTHAECVCVTVSIDSMKFLAPAYIGDIITIKARVTRAFHTSMEIKVYAWARKVHQRSKYLISEAYFTFVALKNKKEKVAVPTLNPITIEEKKEYKTAAERKKKRI
ncbi:MAG: acyl-CoA thioesterase [Sphingobacteriaceae bacterium]|nr:acyl-CoA thioesterase [Sphingobacteriaceae bacterium]